MPRRKALRELLRPQARIGFGPTRQGYQPSQETRPGRVPAKPPARQIPKDARRRRGPSRRYF